VPKGRALLLEIDRAAALAGEVKGFHRTTYGRRRTVSALWQHVIDRRVAAPEATLARLLFQVYGPSSAITMGLTASSLPQLRGNADWEDALRWLRKKAGTVAPRVRKQAAIMTPLDLHKLMVAAQADDTAMTAVVMTITASRHADLTNAYVDRTWKQGTKSVARIRFPTFKSDIYGLREVAKTVEIPTSFLPTLTRIVSHPASYNKVYRMLKQIGTHLSAHSCRRTAVALMGDSFSEQTIIELTMHSMPLEPIAVRRYLEPSPTSELARSQRKTSQFLFSTLAKAARGTRTSVRKL
jgi:hypothetical protein